VFRNILLHAIVNEVTCMIILQEGSCSTTTNQTVSLHINVFSICFQQFGEDTYDRFFCVYSLVMFHMTGFKGGQNQYSSRQVYSSRPCGPTSLLQSLVGCIELIKINADG